MTYAKKVIPQKGAAKGQAFIANVSMGGTVLSGLIGSRLYDLIGVANTLYVSAAIVLLGALIGLFCVQKT